MIDVESRAPAGALDSLLPPIPRGSAQIDAFASRSPSNHFHPFPAFAPRNQGCYPLNRRMNPFSNQS
jgi:hypothetical protein